MARLTFDPRTEDSANAPLEIVFDTGGAVQVAAMNFPPPPQETVGPGSISTEGDQIAARRHQNRPISIGLDVIEPSASASTNLVTNPSLELDTDGWSDTGSIFIGNPGGVTFNRASGGEAGDYSLGVSCAGAADQGVYISLGSLTAGISYYARVNLGVGAGGSSVKVAVGRATSPYTEHVVVAAATTVAHTTYGLVFTPAVTATYHLYARITGTSATYFELDEAFVSASTVATPYFDGDTPGCAWTGTPHASTSNRPASGGPLFRAIIADIEAKAATLAQEGGTLRWINYDGDNFTFDILAAEGAQPPLDITYFAGPVAQIDVNMTALPYARSPEVAYTAHTETSLPWLIFTETGVPGDVPARGRLVITDAQGAADQKTVVWGMESRDLDTSTNLYLQAEAISLTSGNAAVTADAAASGGSKIRFTGAATYSTLNNLGLFSGLTHHGTYRAVARVKTSHIDYRLALRYYPDSGSVVTNATVEVPGPTVNKWHLVDLGLVTVRGDEVPWSFHLLLNSVNTHTLDIDYLLLVPAAEASGQAVSDFTRPLFTNGTLTIAHDSVIAYRPTYGTMRPGYEGDYLFVPPAGGAQRKARFIVKASRDLVGSGSYEDSNFDDLTAQLFVTPRYLSIR